MRSLWFLLSLLSFGQSAVNVCHFFGINPAVIFFFGYVAKIKSRFFEGAVVSKCLLCDFSRLFIADMRGTMQ